MSSCSITCTPTLVPFLCDYASPPLHLWFPLLPAEVNEQFEVNAFWWFAKGSRSHSAFYLGFFRKFSEDLEEMKKGHFIIQQLSERQVDVNKCLRGVWQLGRGADPGRRWQYDNHLFLYLSKVSEKHEGVEGEVKTGRIATRVQLLFQSGLYIHGHRSPGQATSLLNSHCSQPWLSPSSGLSSHLSLCCGTHLHYS